MKFSFSWIWIVSALQQIFMIYELVTHELLMVLGFDRIFMIYEVVTCMNFSIVTAFYLIFKKFWLTWIFKKKSLFFLFLKEKKNLLYSCCWHSYLCWKKKKTKICTMRFLSGDVFSWYLYTLSRKPVLFLFVTSVLFLTVLLFHVPIVIQYLSLSLLILFISFVLCQLLNIKPVDLNTSEWNKKVIYSPHFIHWKCNWKQIFIYTTYTNCTIISETKKMGFDMCTEILEYNTTCI